MADRRSFWRWTLAAAFVCLLAGMGIVFLGGPASHTFGAGMFIVAALAYVTARIALIREDRIR